MTLYAASLCRHAAAGTHVLDLLTDTSGAPPATVPHLDGTLFVEGVFDGAQIAVQLRGLDVWHDVDGSPFTAQSLARIDAHALSLRAVISNPGVGTALSIGILSAVLPPVSEA